MKATATRKSTENYGSQAKPASSGFKVIGDGNTPYAVRPAKPAETSAKQALSPLRIILFTTLLGVFGYFYISHVFYTQQLLSEVNRLRVSFEEIRLDHTDTKLTFERMTGPAEVYERAKGLGLVDAGPADRIISRE